MFYDYKIDDITQDVVLDDYDEIVDDILDEYSMLRRYDFISVYAPVFVIKEILAILLEDENDLFVGSDSNIFAFEEDDKPEILTISYDGQMVVEPACGKDGVYKQPDGVLNYFHDSLPLKQLERLIGFDVPILVFGIEDDELDESGESNCEVHVALNEDGTLTGFHASWVEECDEDVRSYYSYSMHSGCPRHVQEIAELLGIDL